MSTSTTKTTATASTTTPLPPLQQDTLAAPIAGGAHFFRAKMSPDGLFSTRQGLFKVTSNILVLAFGEFLDGCPVRGKSTANRHFCFHGNEQRKRKCRKEGGGYTHVMHGHNRMSIDPRILTMPGRSTSPFHRPDQHCLTTRVAP